MMEHRPDWGEEKSKGAKLKREEGGKKEQQRGTEGGKLRKRDAEE